MKKGFWTSLVAAFALCFALVACGGSKEPAIDPSGFYGVWELSGLTSDGEETSAEDLELMKDYGLNVFLVLNEDGSAKFNMFGEDLEGAWSASSNSEASLNFSDEDDEEVTAPMLLDGDKITMSQEGDTLVFSKSSQEAMDEFLANGSSLEDSLSGLLGSLTGEEEEEVEEKVEEEVEETITQSGATDSIDLDVTVIDDDLLTLTFTKAYVDDSGDFRMNFTATNHSNQEIQLFDTGAEWDINGVKADPTVWSPFDAGETIDDYLFVSEFGSVDLSKLKVSGAFEADNDEYDAIREWSFTL